MKRRNPASSQKSTKKTKSEKSGYLSYLEFLSDGSESETEDEVDRPLDNFNFQTVNFAEYALKHYNQKHGTKYELVDPIDSRCMLVNVVWGHCNFTARNINISQDAPINLFFAELRFPSDAPVKPPSFDPLVTICLILKGKKDYPCDCPTCGYSIKHPPCRFFGEKLTLRSSSHS